MFGLVHFVRRNVPFRVVTRNARPVSSAWFSSSTTTTAATTKSSESLASWNPPLVRCHSAVDDALGLVPVFGSFFSEHNDASSEWTGTVVDDETSISQAAEIITQGSNNKHTKNVLIYQGRNYGMSVQFVANVKRQLRQETALDVHTRAMTVTQEWQLYRQQQRREAQGLNRILVQVCDHEIVGLSDRNFITPANIQSVLRQLLPPTTRRFLVPLRELAARVAADQWRTKGIPVRVPYTGDKKAEHAIQFHIHPHFGVYPPTRQEYLPLLLSAPLPDQSDSNNTAFTMMDIGCGTGVLAALLMKRYPHIRAILSDINPFAINCAKENMERLGLASLVDHVGPTNNLFPENDTPADLVVCNPPWIPCSPDDNQGITIGSWLDRAIFDDAESSMLFGFLQGAPDRLRNKDKSEGWLILSDLAEHLQLRTRDELLQGIHDSGLQLEAIQSAVSTRVPSRTSKPNTSRGKTSSKIRQHQRNVVFPKVAAARQVEQTLLFRLRKR